MPRFLKNKCGGRDFLWHSKAPHERSGGILLGVDQQMFDIGSIVEGGFYIKFQLCNKPDGFKWPLAAVYGPAQATHKEFLAELVCMGSQENLPLVVGGDYNILWKLPTKKNFSLNWCVWEVKKIFHSLLVVITTFYGIHLRKITPIMSLDGLSFSML
jgi:hypothetical protein